MLTYPYTEEQFKKIYDNLPEDLREMIFSAERAEAIYQIAAENNALDFIIEIAAKVEDVLIGFLPPKEFEAGLKKIGVEKETAEKIVEQINQSIFSRVRRGLLKLYEKPSPEVEERLRKIEEKIEKISEAPQTKVAPSQDVYREPVELKNH